MFWLVRARRHPIKVRHSQRQLLGECTECLLFIETSLEKEAWCEVLRAASKSSREVQEWYIKYKLKFQDYCSSLEATTHLITKFHLGANNIGVYVEHSNSSGSDGVSLKGFWSAIEKLKQPKGGGTGSNHMVGHKKALELSSTPHNTNMPTTPPSQHGKIGVGADMGATSNNHNGANNEADSNQGNVFVNMFISRLFFDWSQSLSLQAKYHEQLQARKEHYIYLYHLWKVLKRGSHFSSPANFVNCSLLQIYKLIMVSLILTIIFSLLKIIKSNMLILKFMNAYKNIKTRWLAWCDDRETFANHVEKSDHLML